MHRSDGEHVLVLGGGQIGNEVVRQLREARPEVAVTLWTRTARPDARGDVGLRRGWGDLFRTEEPMVLDGHVLEPAWPDGQDRLRMDGRRIVRIIEKVSPTAVVDCTNVATQLSSIPPNASSSEGWLDTVLTAMTRHVESLHAYLGANADARYVRVSTTGLGGMGLNMPFTHGEAADEILSGNLWRKVIIAGALHQMLWTLERAHPGRVRLVVPAGMVGFEEPTSGSVLVGAGEGRAYTQQDVRLMTHVSMMGLISKETVAASVLDNLVGSPAAVDLISCTHEGLLHPMTDPVLVDGEIGRHFNGPDVTPVSSGNLGSRVAEDLDAVHSILTAAPGMTLARASQLHGRADPARVVTARRRLAALIRSRPSTASTLTDDIPAGNLLALMYDNEGRGRAERGEGAQ